MSGLDDCRTMRTAARTRERVETRYAGVDLVEPGIVPVTGWRPDGAPGAETDRDAGAGWLTVLGGVGIKP